MSLHQNHNVKEQNAGAELHPLAGVARCLAFQNRPWQAVKAAPSGEQASTEHPTNRQAIR